MSSREPESTTLVSVDELVMRLEQILRSQQQDYEKLGQLIERTRQAIRKADMNAIAELCQEENTIAQHVTDLEKARLILAGKLTEMLDPTASKPLSIREVAQAIDEPNRSRMLELSESRITPHSGGGVSIRRSIRTDRAERGRDVPDRRAGRHKTGGRAPCPVDRASARRGVGHTGHAR